LERIKMHTGFSRSLQLDRTATTALEIGAALVMAFGVAPPPVAAITDPVTTVLQSLGDIGVPSDAAIDTLLELAVAIEASSRVAKRVVFRKSEHGKTNGAAVLS
jgi:hypothetical protein